LKKEELVNWFSLGNVDPKASSKILSRRGISKNDECMNSRDRAMISLLYESGREWVEWGGYEGKRCIVR